MNRKNIIILTLVAILALAFVLIKYTNQPDLEQKIKDPEPIAHECNGDGKVCPDGSVVGRTGSDCSFAMCPAPDIKSAKITTTLGQVSTALNVSITPKEVVSDSRCPSDVQCIWAGIVEVRTITATKVSHGEQIFKLNEPKTFGDFEITLIEAAPYPKAGEKIKESSYRFSYEVTRK